MDTSANRPEEAIVSETERKCVLVRLGSAVANKVMLSNVSGSISSALESGRECFRNFDLVHSATASVVKRAETCLMESTRQSHARGTANRAGRIGFGESCALARDSIEDGGVDVIAHSSETEIGVALVVRDY